MNEKPYQPITCAAYDLYEIAIMRHQNLTLHYESKTGEHQQSIVKPLNVKINNAAEYLVCHPVFNGTLDTEQIIEIRLDNIFQADIT